LATATIPADKELYQRQIEATDGQIDGLAYELYGLREEEIGVVRGGRTNGTKTTANGAETDYTASAPL
jgi:hypothetical protein